MANSTLIAMLLAAGAIGATELVMRMRRKAPGGAGALRRPASPDSKPAPRADVAAAASAPRPAEASGGALRAGRAPYPSTRFVELPGVRLVDLRAFPAEVLKAVRLGGPQAQLLLERPMPVQIWVVDLATARAWAALGETSRELLADRLCDPKNRAAKNYVHVLGGSLTEDESKALTSKGIELALEMRNLSDPPRALHEFLEDAVVWKETADDRPVPPYEILHGDPLDRGLIHVIQGCAYVDLRRVDPESWRAGVAVNRLKTAAQDLARREEVTRVVWVIAPWTAELVPEAAFSQLRVLATTLGSREQRLASVRAAGEPETDLALLGELAKAGLAPLGEWTLEPLHDAYFGQVWNKPRI